MEIWLLADEFVDVEAANPILTKWLLTQQASIFF